MRAIRAGLLALVFMALGLVSALAEQAQPVAVARFLPEGSAIVNDGAGLSVSLRLSRPVPYRVSTLANPPRLVLDFREVDWTGFDGTRLNASDRVTALRAGELMPGWSRLVLALNGPYRVAKAEMATRAQQGEAVVGLKLLPESSAEFLKDAQAAVPQDWALPKPAKITGAPRTRQDGHRPLVVVLDPGHGGIDPGSVYGHVDEKQITLSFGLELRDLLLAHGIQVVMTRTSDVFVPLEDRLSIARAAHADLFIAIHADAETSHEAVGATVYTLSTRATDRASAELAARHDRDDIMAGVDLSDTDDVIAKVLMSMARTENMPRSEAFAGDLVTAIKGDGIRMHRRPHQEASFSVLKSPDVPSVLVELGYLSSPSDRRNMLDPAWRKRMAAAMLQAIRKWAKEDAAQALLLRQ